MKKVALASLPFLVVILFYSAGSLMAASFNISDWSIETRFSVAVFGPVCIIASCIAMYEEIEKL